MVRAFSEEAQARVGGVGDFLASCKRDKRPDDSILFAGRFAASTKEAAQEFRDAVLMGLARAFREHREQATIALNSSPIPCGWKFDAQWTFVVLVAWDPRGADFEEAKQQCGQLLHNANFGLLPFKIEKWLDMRLTQARLLEKGEKPTAPCKYHDLSYIIEGSGLEQRVREVVVPVLQRRLTVGAAEELVSARVDGGSKPEREAGSSAKRQRVGESGGGGGSSGRGGQPGAGEELEGVEDEEDMLAFEEDMLPLEEEGDGEEGEQARSKSFYTAFRLSDYPWLVAKLKRLCGNTVLRIPLNEKFFSQDKRGLGQAFYLGDMFGDGSIDEERGSFSRAAQSADCGFLLQFGLDIGGLGVRGVTLSFRSTQWRRRSRRLAAQYPLMTLAVSNSEMVKDLAAVIPAGHKGRLFNAAYERALRERIKGFEPAFMFGLLNSDGGGTMEPGITLTTGSQRAASMLRDLLLQCLPQLYREARDPSAAAAVGEEVESPGSIGQPIMREGDHGGARCQISLRGRYVVSAFLRSGSLLAEEELRRQGPWCVPQLWLRCAADVQVDDAPGCFMLHRVLVARKILWVEELCWTQARLIPPKGWGLVPVVFTLTPADHPHWFSVVGKTWNGPPKLPEDRRDFVLVVDRCGVVFIAQKDGRQLAGYRSSCILTKAAYSDIEMLHTGEAGSAHAIFCQKLMDTYNDVVYLGNGAPAEMRLKGSPGRVQPFYDCTVIMWRLINLPMPSCDPQSEGSLRVITDPQLLGSLAQLKGGAAVVRTILEALHRAGLSHVFTFDPNVAPRHSAGRLDDMYYLGKEHGATPILDILAPEDHQPVAHLGTMAQEAREEQGKDYDLLPSAKSNYVAHLSIGAFAVHVGRFSNKRIPLAFLYHVPSYGERPSVDAVLRLDNYARLSTKQTEGVWMKTQNILYAQIETAGGTTGAPPLHNANSQYTAGGSPRRTVVEGAELTTVQQAVQGCSRYGFGEGRLIAMQPEQLYQRLVQIAGLAVGQQVYIMYPGLCGVYLGRGVVVEAIHFAFGGHLSDRFRIGVKLVEVDQAALAAKSLFFKGEGLGVGSVWEFAVASDVLQLLPPDCPAETVAGPAAESLAVSQVSVGVERMQVGGD